MSIYISKEPQFCIYLTIYSGDKMPMFYIGSGKIENILNKKKSYRGSVSSKRYKKIWKQELKENPHLFRTIILYKFYSRKNAIYNERLLQIQFNVVKSDQFINMSIATVNGMFGMDNSGENHPQYNKSKSVETRDKISETRIKNETAKGVNNPRYGIHDDFDTYKKISKSNKGKPKNHTEEYLTYLSNHMKINNPSKIPEIQEKISKGNSGKKRTQEQNLMNSIRRTGTKATDETREKMSKGRKGKFRYASFLLLKIIYCYPEEVPPGFYRWSAAHGFVDKELKKLYPKSLFYPSK